MWRWIVRGTGFEAYYLACGVIGVERRVDGSGEFGCGVFDGVASCW